MSEKEKAEAVQRWEENPKNEPGAPDFFPKVGLKSFGGIGEGKPAELLECGHYVKKYIYSEAGMFKQCKYGHRFPR